MIIRKEQHLHKRLVKTFFLQGFLIALATTLGIFLTNWLLSSLLVEEALEREANYYWDSIALNPDMPMANSLNLKGYLLPRDKGQLNETIDHLNTGYHLVEKTDKPFVYYITEKDDQKLVLIFNRAQVNSLISLYGVAPLLLTLILLYLITYVTYRFAHRTISPTISLANKVRNLDPKNPDATTFELNQFEKNIDIETTIMAGALSDFVNRISAFIERERAFSRDASHELRTPITVIKSASHILQSNDNLDDYQRGLISRIQKSADTMANLTETFLTLAREQDIIGGIEKINLDSLVKECINDLTPAAQKKNIVINHRSVGKAPIINGNKSAVSIVLNNLLNNAIKYTESGEINILVAENHVVVEDTGIGIDESMLPAVFKPYIRANKSNDGHGVGLSIVRKLCDQFGWGINMKSAQGIGTQVTVQFS